MDNVRKYICNVVAPINMLWNITLNVLNRPCTKEGISFTILTVSIATG
jgi:hypothetical protein